MLRSPWGALFVNPTLYTYLQYQSMYDRVSKEVVGGQIPGYIQGEAQQGYGQLNLVEDVPAECRRGWIGWPSEVPSNREHSLIY